MRHVIANRAALHWIGHREDMRLDLKTWLGVVAGLGLAFQIGHFAEHAVQFGVWFGGAHDWVAATFCGRGTPYMSRPVTEAVTLAGTYLFPDAAPPRQMMLAMELLHLVGNAVFLATIGAVCALTRSKWSRYAFYIEAAHLCEHLSLTLTAFYVGVPIGVSTLFGRARALLGSDGAVGWRVSWHFFMNLLPMPLTMVALMMSWPDLTGTRLPASPRRHAAS